jgi:alkylation response protein AidB-like acyl-CoA dehydrogenase
VDFNLTDVQRAWQSKAEALARALPDPATAAEVIARAARAELVDARSDLLAAVVAVEALACESAAAGMALALHTSAVLGVSWSQAAQDSPRAGELLQGDIVGAIALSSEQVPQETNGRLSGWASWVAPLTTGGLALVGARRSADPGDDGGAHGLRAEPVVCAVALDGKGVSFEPVETAAIGGLICGHVTFDDAPCVVTGETRPVMASVRILLAAAGLGMGRRAVREALVAARAYHRMGAGGEQTVQGLVADAATELDAARLLTWKAASAARLSLAEASMAKLAATDATQGAVARATQVVGGDSFQRGHVIERLAQDVRALELFAGRTEALREAVADEVL